MQWAVPNAYKYPLYSAPSPTQERTFPNQPSRRTLWQRQLTAGASRLCLASVLPHAAQRWYLPQGSQFHFVDFPSLCSSLCCYNIALSSAGLPFGICDKLKYVSIALMIVRADFLVSCALQFCNDQSYCVTCWQPRVVLKGGFWSVCRIGFWLKLEFPVWKGTQVFINHFVGLCCCSEMYAEVVEVTSSSCRTPAAWS